MVSFQAEKTKGKEKAINVRALKDEQDLDLIQKLAFRNEEKYWIEALPVFCREIEATAAINYIDNKLAQLQNKHKIKKFLGKLPLSILMKNKSYREKLALFDRAEKCLEIIKDENLDQSTIEEFIEEALDCINKEEDEGGYYYRKKIPRNILLKNKKLREKLTPSWYFDFLREEIEDKLQKGEEYTEYVYEVKNLCSKKEWIGKKINELPDVIINNDPEIRKCMELKEHIEICKNFIADKRNKRINYLEIIKEIVTRLSENDYYLETFWGKIPTEYLEEYDEIIEMVPDEKYLEIKCKNYFETEENEKKKIVSDIEKRLRKAGENAKELVYRIPKEIMNTDILFEYLTPREKIIKLLEKADKNEEYLNKIYVIIKDDSQNRERLLELLKSEHFLMNKQLFELLKPNEQVKIIDKNNCGNIREWRALNDKAKLYYIYKNSKENNNLEYLLSEINQENIIINFALMILWAKYNPEKKEKAFARANDILQDYVVNEAMTNNNELEFEPLLPKCKPGVVKYCETRPWPTENDLNNKKIKSRRAFCPREKKECEFFSAGDKSFKKLTGAKLYPDMNLDWENWTLIELLEYAQIKPEIEDIKDGYEYVPKLCGWINRLNEIRERLKCSICGETLIPNKKYAKNLARYNSTVASCTKGGDHDVNIYLNHCWACRGIIDSRETRIMVENYYLCLHCGTGPQNSKSYTQGDVCPNCGSNEIKHTNERDRVCDKCKHNFRIPPKQYLTGN